ncbi:MAG TPA: RNase adapter RapZ [Candidatus Nitrosotalea sp.]|nr:RNase adapter RapZ [Candidatus Nitrosotalea sp.]
MKPAPPRLLLVSAPDRVRAEADLAQAGFEIGAGEPARPERDLALLLTQPTAELLARADAAGLQYTLIHVGAADGEPQGSFERAHHRIGPEALGALAGSLSGRRSGELELLAFAYRAGLPAAANWVLDVRFLDNPYWVSELRDLDGFDPRVSAYVLEQPAAQTLLQGLEALLRAVLPLYARGPLCVAFGCTGGRHRSVALAEEMARRLADLEGLEVTVRARDLAPP